MQSMMKVAPLFWEDLDDFLDARRDVLKFASFFVATILIILPIVTIFFICVFVILGATTFIFIGAIICNFVPLRVPSEFSQWYNRNYMNHRSLFIQLSQWIKHGSMDSNNQSQSNCKDNSFGNVISTVNYNYSSIDADRLPLIRACCVNYGLNSSEKYCNPLKTNNEFGNYFANNIDNCFKNVQFKDIKRECAQYSNYRCTNTVTLVLKSFWNDIEHAADDHDVMFDVIDIDDAPILIILYIFVTGLIFLAYFLSRIVWLVSLSILMVEQLTTFKFSLTTSKYIKYPHSIVFFLYFSGILIIGIIFIKLIYFDLYYLQWMSPFVNSFESFGDARKKTNPSMRNFVQYTPTPEVFEVTKDYIADYFYPRLINNHESVFIIKHYCSATFGGQGDVISDIIIQYFGMSKDFQSIDSYIDYHFNKYEYDNRVKYKILLLGITNSGKSTLFRQFCRWQTIFDINNYEVVSDEENDPREFAIAIRQQIIKDFQRIVKVMNQSPDSDFDYNKVESSMDRIANIDTSISTSKEINLQTIQDIKLVWNNLIVDHNQETALKWMAKCGFHDSTGMYIHIYTYVIIK